MYIRVSVVFRVTTRRERAIIPLRLRLAPPLDPSLKGFAPPERHHSYLALSVTCLARGRKAHLFSERNRSLACPFLPSIFPSGGSLGASWWHIGALLGYLQTAIGFLGDRMSCFPHLDSPSVLGASGQELQSEPALVSLKQTSGRAPKT